MRHDQSGRRVAEVWGPGARALAGAGVTAAAAARVLLLLGRQYWKSGQKTLADRHVQDAIALLETLPPSRELAMAYSARAQLAMTGDHVEETLEFGQRATRSRGTVRGPRRAGRTPSTTSALLC